MHMQEMIQIEIGCPIFRDVSPFPSLTVHSTVHAYTTPPARPSARDDPAPVK